MGVLGGVCGSFGLRKGTLERSTNQYAGEFLCVSMLKRGAVHSSIRFALKCALIGMMIASGPRSRSSIGPYAQAQRGGKRKKKRSLRPQNERKRNLSILSFSSSLTFSLSLLRNFLSMIFLPSFIPV